MYNDVTDDFKKYISKTSRKFNARIKINNKWYDSGIKSLTFTGGSNGEDDITIGSTVSAYIDVTMKNTGLLFENTEVELQIGLLTDNKYEYVPMGIFKAARPEEIDGRMIKFTAYDRMINTEVLFVSELTYPATALQVLNEACKLSGITRSTTGLGTLYIQEKPQGYTCREIIGYIAALYGKFAVIDRKGKLQLKWYDETYDLSISRQFSMTKNQSDNVIGRIECSIDKDTQLVSGTGTRGISISDPWMTQAQLDSIYAVLNGFTYRAGECEFLGDIRLEPWDIVLCSDLSGNVYRLPVMTVVHTYDGGISTKVQAVGKTEAESDVDFKGPSVKAMERTYTELLMVNKLVANKVDADWVNAHTITADKLEAVNAEIVNLKTNKLDADTAKITYADINKFNAVEGKVGKLEATSLTASSAVITDLTAHIADINTLMFGNAAGGSLVTSFSNSVAALIGNAQIKSAMIDSIVANKIIGGQICTNVVDIVSEDGNMKIKNNTILIRDINNIPRVQIGKDAEADYNMYVWDKNGRLMFDASGITQDGIKKKIIRDDMVSDNANISANKLNIDTLFDAINNDNTHTINSSHIYVDANGQRLDVSFKSMTDSLNDLSGKITQQGTAVNVIQGKIDQRIWKSDIDDAGRNKLDTSVFTQELDTINARLSQIDSEINNDVNIFWVDEIPTLDNEPAVNWGTPLTLPFTLPAKLVTFTSEKLNKHLSDIAYVNGTDKCYRFSKKEDGTYYWKLMANNEYTALLSKITDITANLDGISSTVSQVEKNIKIKADNKIVNEISNNLTQLKQSYDKFTVSVGETYVTTDTLSGYCTTKEAQALVDYSAGNITQQISESYVTQGDFDSLTIGGRNYLPMDRLYWEQGTISNGVRTDSIRRLRTKTAREIDSATQYIISRYGTGKIILFFYDNGYKFISSHDWYTTFPNSFTTPAGAKYFNAVIAYNDDSVISQDKDISDIRFKIEKGDRVTDWTPAPEDYTTVTSFTSKIEETSKSILQSVSGTYATKDSVNTVTGQIALKIDKNDTGQIISMINASADEIYLTSDRFTLNSTYAKIAKDGVVDFTSGRIGGAYITADYMYANSDSTGLGLIWSSNQIYNNVALWAGKPNTSFMDSPLKIYHDGTIDASKGTIGGWKIDKNALYSDYGDYRVYIQNFKSDNPAGQWIISTQTKAQVQTPGIVGYNPTFVLYGNGDVYSKGKVRFDGTADFYGVTKAHGEFYVNTDKWGECAVACTNPTQNIFIWDSGADIQIYVNTQLKARIAY